MTEQQSKEREQALEEWRTSGRRSTKDTEFKIRNSWGIYDAYKKIRKNKWYDIGRPLKEHEFYSIIRGINDLMAEELCQGNTLTFPSRMGKLELRKFQVGVWLDKDDRLHNTYPIDWWSTLLLWRTDKEAEQQRIILHREEPWIYRVRYNKGKANYNNKVFYQFYLNTFINRKLYKNIKQGKTDTIYGGRNTIYKHG